MVSKVRAGAHLGLLNMAVSLQQIKNNLIFRYYLCTVVKNTQMFHCIFFWGIICPIYERRCCRKGLWRKKTLSQQKTAETNKVCLCLSRTWLSTSMRWREIMRLWGRSTSIRDLSKTWYKQISKDIIAKILETHICFFLKKKSCNTILFNVMNVYGNLRPDQQQKRSQINS